MKIRLIACFDDKYVWIILCQEVGHLDQPNLNHVCTLEASFSVHSFVNPLPNNEILHWSELKAFADDSINLTEILKFVLGKVESFVGKGENAGHQHFLLFPQCFQKAF